MAAQFIDEIVEMFSLLTSPKKNSSTSPHSRIRDVESDPATIYTILNRIMMISEKYEVATHENLHLAIGRLDALLWTHRIPHESREEEGSNPILEVVRTEEEKKYEMRMMKSIVDNDILKEDRYFSSSSSDSQFIIGLTLYIGAVIQRLKDISYSTSATKLLFGTTAEDDTMMDKYEKMYYHIENISVAVDMSLGNILNTINIVDGTTEKCGEETVLEEE